MRLFIRPSQGANAHRHLWTNDITAKPAARHIDRYLWDFCARHSRRLPAWLGAISIRECRSIVDDSELSLFPIGTQKVGKRIRIDIASAKNQPDPFAGEFFSQRACECSDRCRAGRFYGEFQISKYQCHRSS